MPSDARSRAWVLRFAAAWVAAPSLPSSAVRQEPSARGRAAPVLERAVTLTERACGPSSLAVCWALNELGMCCKFLARFAEAGPLYQRALAIAEARLGPDHADVASLYHNLGGLEHAAGNWMRGE